MEERRLHLFDYLTVVRRRRWWLVVPIVVATLVGAALAVLLPREYRSYTTLAITTPSLAPGLVPSQPDLAERVRAISQDLLSRPVLERVAREEGLTQDATIDAAVNAIRAGTTVAPAKTISTSSRSGPDTFVVAYVGPTRELAQRIANRLATVFIDEQSKSGEARAEDTSAFLANQLSQSNARLRAIEEKLRKVKEANVGRLPEQMDANLQMAGGLRHQQENAALSLRSEQDRLALIERQLEGMKQGAAEAPPARYSAGATPLQRLGALRAELHEASLMYTEKHPEIVRLKEEIASTEAAIKLESSRPAAERAPVLNADPTYQRLLADRESSRLRVRDLERAANRISGEISRYQGRVDAAPMVEQQLLTLNREHELEKQQYNALSTRYQNSLIAEDLVRRRGGEQFTVLYPAFRPSRPDSPNVPRLMVLAVLAGVILGGVLALGREYIDRSVYDARVLQQEFDLPVLAEIPRIALR